jgi:RNA polymerase sigma-70 factor, ECF subfamily
LRYASRAHTGHNEHRGGIAYSDHMPAPAAIVEEDGLAAKLLRLARAREQDTWEQISTAITPMIFRLALRVTADESVAHDAVQETLLRIYDRAEQFQVPEVGAADLAAERWVKRVAVTTTLMLIRSERRTHARENRFPVRQHQASDAHGALERREESDLVQQAIAGLPADQRAVVSLRYLAELPTEEIVAALSITPATVRKRLERGLRRLRRQLRIVGAPALTLSGIGEVAGAELLRPHSWIAAISTGKILTAAAALLVAIGSIGVVCWPRPADPAAVVSEAMMSGSITPDLAHGLRMWQEGYVERAAEYFQRALVEDSDADITALLEVVGADEFARMQSNAALARICEQLDRHAAPDWRERAARMQLSQAEMRVSGEGSNFSGASVMIETDSVPADEASADDKTPSDPNGKG